MLTDSIKKNGTRSSLSLNVTTIEIIAGYKRDQLQKIYERYNIRYLLREILIWEKLGKHNVAETIKSIIDERKEASRIIKMSRLKSNIKGLPANEA